MRPEYEEAQRSGGSLRQVSAAIPRLVLRATQQQPCDLSRCPAGNAFQIQPSGPRWLLPFVPLCDLVVMWVQLDGAWVTWRLQIHLRSSRSRFPCLGDSMPVFKMSAIYRRRRRRLISGKQSACTDPIAYQ